MVGRPLVGECDHLSTIEQSDQTDLPFAIVGEPFLAPENVGKLRQS
jgi:hypothetical protein